MKLFLEVTMSYYIQLTTTVNIIKTAVVCYAAKKNRNVMFAFIKKHNDCYELNNRFCDHPTEIQLAMLLFLVFWSL